MADLNFKVANGMLTIDGRQETTAGRSTSWKTFTKSVSTEINLRFLTPKPVSNLSFFGQKLC